MLSPAYHRRGVCLSCAIRPRPRATPLSVRLPLPRFCCFSFYITSSSLRLKYTPSPAMEDADQQVETADKKVHAHYNHVLPSKYARWTARQSFQFMYGRPWCEVQDFYSDIVNGRLSLSTLFRTQVAQDPLVQDSTRIPEASEEVGFENVLKEDRTGRWARNTFKIVLSYHGACFDGWQKQPGLNTVQGLVERSLGKFVDEKKVEVLKDKGLPVEGCAVVAGRTDKGVTALQQVCSFYTWRENVVPRDIEESINQSAPGQLRVVSVSEVSRAFHPNFSAKWRRYLYIFPLNDGENQDYVAGEYVETMGSNIDLADSVGQFHNHIGGTACEDLVSTERDELDWENKPTKFSVHQVNCFLQQLEGKLLSYKMFARDTKASRSIGPPTECFMYHARAAEATLRCMDHGDRRKVVCIELVANRFLRKMVRVLVATAIREAAAGADEDVLIKLMDSTCRRATAPPAPPDGLCLVDVGYGEFDPRNCLIVA